MRFRVHRFQMEVIRSHIVAKKFFIIGRTTKEIQEESPSLFSSCLQDCNPVNRFALLYDRLPLAQMQVLHLKTPHPRIGRSTKQAGRSDTQSQESPSLLGQLGVQDGTRQYMVSIKYTLVDDPMNYVA